MRLVCLLVVTGLCFTPRHAAAQPWVEAYEAGDYATAAAHLQRLVARSHLDDEPEGALPARYLATMYARGLGVEQDQVLACALAQHANILADQWAPKYADDVRAYESLMADSQRFVDTHCGGLWPEEQVAAAHSAGCNAFGLREQRLAVGPHVVEISRQGIGLAGSRRPWLDGLECPTLISDLRAFTVAPPADALDGVKARHFLDAATWHLGRRPQDQQLVYVLKWHLFEVDTRGIGHGGLAELATQLEWPAASVEADVSFEMIRTGHVRWRIDGDPPRRGWLMRGGDDR